MEGPPDRLEPVPHLASADVSRRIALVAVFAALAIAGRLAFLWAPNFALTYYVVFLAGVLLGARAGIAVALVAMTATNLMLSGLSPVLLANGPAMAMFGLLGGLFSRIIVAPARTRLERALKAAILFSAGLFGTFLFSVLVDLFGYMLRFALTPEGATIGSRALVPVLIMGLLFNLGPAVANALLFMLATPAILAMLEASGHLREASGGFKGARTGRGSASRARTPGRAQARSTRDPRGSAPR